MMLFITNPRNASVVYTVYHTCKRCQNCPPCECHFFDKWNTFAPL